MEELDIEFEINRPHDAGRLYNFLISYKFQTAVGILPFSLKDLSVLDICCGSGMMSEYYAKKGAKVSGIDLSPEAVERASIRSKKYNFQAEFRIADSTDLPFPDNSFDIVSVHDGLHHLSNPKKAVLEMARVAKKGVIIIEPAKAVITSASVLLGISKEYEETDFVYRFRKDELASWFREGGINKVIVERYIMYYPHQPGRFFRIFDNRLLFYIAQKLFQVLNILFGEFGNKIQVIGLK